MPSITEIVKNRVQFESYRNGIFLYKVNVGEEVYTFPVPLADVEGATLPCEDKGIFFMRWIRKALVAKEFVQVSAPCELSKNLKTGKMEILDDVGNIIGVQG